MRIHTPDPLFVARDFPDLSPFSLWTESYLVGCTNITDTRLTSPEKAGYVFTAFVSMVASLFVALTIFYNRKLNQHPSPLIGFMCLCEGISCFNCVVWAIGPVDFACYFGLHYLYNWTTFAT